MSFCSWIPKYVANIPGLEKRKLMIHSIALLCLHFPNYFSIMHCSTDLELVPWCTHGDTPGQDSFEFLVQRLPAFGINQPPGELRQSTLCAAITNAGPNDVDGQSLPPLQLVSWALKRNLRFVCKFKEIVVISVLTAWHCKCAIQLFHDYDH